MIINKLLANNIEPMVTMYHYDLPEALNLFGGFTNPQFVNFFSDYARLLFETFGDRVQYWITFNEPFDYCLPGYGEGNYPPMGTAAGIADYLCLENTLKAHSKAYEMYKMYYRNKQKGKIGITFSSRFYYSKTNNLSIIDRALQYGVKFIYFKLGLC